MRARRVHRGSGVSRTVEAGHCPPRPSAYVAAGHVCQQTPYVVRLALRMCNGLPRSGYLISIAQLTPVSLWGASGPSQLAAPMRTGAKLRRRSPLGHSDRVGHIWRLLVACDARDIRAAKPAAPSTRSHGSRIDPQPGGPGDPRDVPRRCRRGDQPNADVVSVALCDDLQGRSAPVKPRAGGAVSQMRQLPEAP